MLADATSFQDFGKLLPFFFGNQSIYLYRIEHLDVGELLASIHPEPEFTVHSFDSAHNDLPIRQVMTERGVCFTLNAPLSEIQVVGSERKFDGPQLQTPVACAYSKNQCYAKIDTYKSTISYAIHSPFELASNDLQFTRLGLTEEVIASYVVHETISSDRLRDLSIKQRKCVFNDELSKNYKFYNHKQCIMKCRAYQALEICRCIPHFYPFVDGPACKIGGLMCLSRNPEWYDKSTCQCMKPCNDVVFLAVASRASQWSFEGGIPFKAKSSIRWEIVQPKTRYYRDVVFSLEDLLASFGGGIGLFIGKNLFSSARLIEFCLFEAAKKIQHYFLKL
ncbi:uncharacterized protein LOC129756225 [Uranotaenia lowii]|uniref:uncharacterized protein LOC129756225 n=1 Tax=Uranotaenia lowii TaxID=190385 RepID=UPI0024790595|nr:uncharacterized protein LOC129756225 [Uranotaenia lowii]